MQEIPEKPTSLKKKMHIDSDGHCVSEVMKARQQHLVKQELDTVPKFQSGAHSQSVAVNCKPSITENTQYSTLLLKPHYLPIILSQSFMDIPSQLEGIQGVQICPISPHTVNSVVMQVIFRSSSDHLIMIQLCYCNLIYEDVDAIVNCSCQLSGAMQKNGGTTLQVELDKYIASYQARAAGGVSVVLESGNLRCKKIIHSFMFQIESECNSDISFVGEALQCAQKHKLGTISFPFSSTETLSAENLIHDIKVFFVQNPDSCVYMLRIVCSSEKQISAFCGIKEFNCKQSIVDLPKSVPLRPHLTGSTKQQWYWQADDGTFVPYSKAVSEKLSGEHKASPTGRCYFEINSYLYVANLERMEQTNTSTRTVRKMKVSYENENEPKGAEDDRTGIIVGVEWLYSSKGRRPTPYSASDSSTVEQLYFNSTTSATLTVGLRRFKLDFKTMKKQPLQPSEATTLCIERKVSVYQQQCSPPPKWYYMGDAKRFVPYTSQESVSIERIYQSKIVTTVFIQSREYTFDFTEMKQVNVKTDYKRSIKRELSPAKDTNSENKTVSRHHICKGIVVAFKGLSENIELARTAVEAKFTSLLSTHELPLPSFISSSLHFQKRIMNIVKEYNVLSSQTISDRSGATNKDDSRVLILRGEATLIQTAIKAVMEEISLIASRDLGCTVASPAHHETPLDWQPQTKNTELFELPKSGEEFSHIESLIHQTMPTAVIQSVKRIQNNWLWERYVLTRRRISKKNSGRVNERELFHGSRSSRAYKIYDSEEGFDMRYSSQGMWGQANYFAEKASYSNSYAYELGDGTREILLAMVVTGDSYKCQSNRTLRMPPVKANLDSRFHEERYDTVEGETSDSKVFMTYSNDKAYPAYLIVYTPDSRTTVYARSSSHARAAQASTSPSSWSYNLTPNTASAPPHSSRHNSATGGGSRSLASGTNYDARPQRPRSTTNQTTSPSGQSSSDQKTCLLQ